MPHTELSVVIVFRRIAEAINSLSEEDIKKLSDPQYEVEIRGVRRRVKDDSKVNSIDLDVENIIRQISSLPTREDAHMFLDQNYSSKRNLELIARRLDIPIVRQDKVDSLRDKIIEVTVGARIRSQAIQGTNI